MEAHTTISQMMAGNKIIVPSYQRAYSWDTPSEDSDRITQTDVFLADLEEHMRSDSNSAYYFGHFLFEEKGNRRFFVIDGQQRLTTIVIFLSALFSKLKEFRNLTEREEICYEDMVKRRSQIRFQTVDYDNQLFKDYVIEQTKIDHRGIETESARRIVRAFDYFKDQLTGKSENYLEKILNTIRQSTCTTHTLQNESEAVQMFIFQNNRGKKPTNLEIVKARFMHNVHLYGNDEKDSLIKEIQNRFEKIYKSISSIEYRVDEDEILLYAQRVHFNSLWETNSLERIDKELSKEGSINFIREFTRLLSSSFEYLSTFFGKDEQKSFAIHSLVTLGGIAIALPFIIKAYKFGLQLEKIEKLCYAFESLILRHRLIGTRADIRSRIKSEFENFTDARKDIRPIVKRIEKLKTTWERWWHYWNNVNFEEALQGELHHSTAKHILWKYENHLLISKGKAGYKPIRYDNIEDPELEHIAPIKEPKIELHGYDVYDNNFIDQYIHCVGNYLLLSKSHNASISNEPFYVKHRDYIHLEQQREVRELVPNPKNATWNREVIRKRKEKIIQFILDNY